MMVLMSTHARRPTPTHRSRRPHRSFLGLPRWGVAMGLVLVLVGASVSLLAALPTGLLQTLTGNQNGITRAIDPSGIQPGPEAVSQPEAETFDQPSLAAKVTSEQGVPAPRVRQVQDAIAPETGLPEDSGTGRRVVYSESRQRVWLVNDGEQVEASYAVSGSAYDNLDPGTFEVYSRSEHATSFDGGSTMDYFVRFTKGPTGAAIGFHDIPVLHSGELIQSVDELGTPLSHGCIRQAPEDALALWEFAPIGTTVVVTA